MKATFDKNGNLNIETWDQGEMFLLSRFSGEMRTIIGPGTSVRPDGDSRFIVIAPKERDTAVEGEHGAIPEKEKPDQLLNAIGCNDTATTWERKLAAAIRREIDERIAAIQLQGVDIGGKWLDHPGFRVKPKPKEGA